MRDGPNIIIEMSEVASPVDDLVLDLLEWLVVRPRPYGEVMDVWRTSCPRLPVWEEANDRGFISREFEVGTGSIVRLTTLGVDHVTSSRFSVTDVRSVAA